MKRIFTLLIFLTLIKTAWAQPHISEELLLPQYMQGYGYLVDPNHQRLPYACRLKISGLTPGATYRYHNYFLDTNGYEIGEFSVVKESGFIKIEAQSFAVPGRYGELTADSQGNYTGWFVVDATSADPNATAKVIIRLNDGAGGTVQAYELETTGTVTILNFEGIYGEPATGTGIWSRASGGTSKNFVMLYDNEAGTGRPIAGTFIEDIGPDADLSVENGYVAFYADNVNSVDKAWGTIIPNNFPNGIRKIAQYKLSDGTEVASNVSADGTWPAAGGGTVSTVNATQGSAALVIDGDVVALVPPRLPQTVSFTSTIPAEAGIGEAGFMVTASSTSGLTDFQYSVSPAGVLEISGNTVIATGVGNARITAYQPGNADYEPASVVSSLITVKKRQNITFANILSKTYGDDVFTLEVASDNNSIPLTLASSDPSVAEVFYESLEARWKIQIHGAGEVTITASQASNAEYFEAAVTKSFSVQKKALTIKADDKTRVVNTASPALTATYDGFIGGEDENDLTSPAVLNTTADADSPVGEYMITVAGATSPNYDITFVNGKLFVVNKLQTISFPAISNKTYGAEPFDPGATSTAGTSPVYASSNTAVAVIENNQVHIKGVGQVRITATFPAVDDYASTASDRTFSVIKKPLTVTAMDKTKAYGQDNPQLTVQYTGFVYDETGDALSTKPVLLTDAGKTSPVGTYSITVSGATSVNYDITYEYGTLLIARAPLLIKAENKNKSQGQPNPPLTASYDGFVNGETAAMLTTLPTLYTAVEASSPVGTYPIAVSGASAGNYAITYEDGIFTVKQKTRTLTFNPLPAHIFGDADFDPAAILSSGELIEYRSSNTNVAEIVNGKIHIVAAGVTEITASAPANSSYENTPTIRHTLVVNRSPQFITFDPVPDLVEGTPYQISVLATSGLPVEFTIVDTRIASLEGNLLIPHRSGITRITATQPGNTNYLPAEVFAQRIQVTDTEGDVIAVHQALSINGDGVNESLVIDGIENYQENRLVIVNRNGIKVFEIDNYNNETNAFQGKGNTNYYGHLPQGPYFYVLEFRANNGKKRKTGYFVLKY